MTDQSETLTTRETRPDLQNRGYVLTRFGDADAMELRDLDMPQAHEDEIVLRVHASSVNPVDYKIRDGEAPFVEESALPVILGRDVSGTIENMGPDAHNMLRRGDRIVAHMGEMVRGGHARFVRVKAMEMTALPDNVDMVEAGTMPLVAMTAWQGLFDHGHLREGQSVLIHGAAGGVGHVAVQLAKAKGAKVIATAGTDDLDFVRGLGADRVIDYKKEQFEDQVADVDMVFDLVGGETRDRSWSVLRKGGVLITTLSEPDSETAAKHEVRAETYMAHPDPKALGQVVAMMADGKLKVTIAERHAFEDIRTAYDRAENGHLRGKVAIVME
ncbi:NADP-dependent oxidoreductase [Stakelama pacifica]|uniref:NADPH:quinone reductase-like Zn-dependent oxidoreductase n=2 Tax=Stakelama pacifica TaxID=517720 RepID=A0A4R6FVT9_9SPHN|nr:NADP-dependent oxidoreductase [Stakelama pacifica]TDN85410.1 NADPH:quinone reductase-like Zn-dependent oxidoreductase [Stakelama pacifica]